MKSLFRFEVLNSLPSRDKMNLLKEAAMGTLDFMIRSEKDLKDAVEELGFLPFFTNSIPGFSIEEHVSPEIWFTDEPGPWEWKGPVIRSTGCAYGKFFEHKAAYISPRFFPDFANFRRDGYDFDSRYEEGLATQRENTLYNLVSDNAPILSRNLKVLGNYRKGGAKGFDPTMLSLQSGCYVLISDFRYMTDRFGRRYGWGVAEYSTPERFMGASFTDRVYEREPEESLERILSHFQTILPGTQEEAILRFLKK